MIEGRSEGGSPNTRVNLLVGKPSHPSPGVVDDAAELVQLDRPDISLLLPPAPPLAAPLPLGAAAPVPPAAAAAAPVALVRIPADKVSVLPGVAGRREGPPVTPVVATRPTSVTTTVATVVAVPSSAADGPTVAASVVDGAAGRQVSAGEGEGGCVQALGLLRGLWGGLNWDLEGMDRGGGGGKKRAVALRCCYLLASALSRS